MGWAARQNKESRAAGVPLLTASETDLAELRAIDNGWFFVSVFLGVWKAGVRGANEMGKCHRNTQVAAACLRGLGFSVEPRRVFIEVERVDRTHPRIVLGVSPDFHKSGIVTGGPWFGHLVLIVEGRWLVDVSVGQYTSQRDGIDAPPCLVMAWNGLPPPIRHQAQIRNVTVTYWEPSTDDGAWRHDWNPIEIAKAVNVQGLINATVAEARARVDDIRNRGGA